MEVRILLTIPVRYTIQYIFGQYGSTKECEQHFTLSISKYRPFGNDLLAGPFWPDLLAGPAGRTRRPDLFGRSLLAGPVNIYFNDSSNYWARINPPKCSLSNLSKSFWCPSEGIKDRGLPWERGRTAVNFNSNSILHHGCWSRQNRSQRVHTMYYHLYTTCLSSDRQCTDIQQLLNMMRAHLDAQPCMPAHLGRFIHS